MVTVTRNDIAITGLHCSFGATTDIKRPYRYHWMRDGVLIAGAPSACSYTTPPLRESDLHSKFSVRVFGLDGEVEVSNEAALSGATKKPIEQVLDEATIEPEGEIT